jgi:hypothetical protein
VKNLNVLNDARKFTFGQKAAAVEPNPTRAPEPQSEADLPRDPETNELMDPIAEGWIAEEAQSTAGTGRTRLVKILNLIQPPLWHEAKGFWKNDPAGWRNSRTDTVLTFADARRLIEARIIELQLERATVLTFPARHFFDPRDWDNFQALSFDERMSQFKSA